MIRPFNSVGRELSQSLVESQKPYSAEQVKMAQDSPHLVWVNPPNRGLSKAVRMEVYARDGGVCSYCDELLSEEEFTVDHIYPWSLGGSDELESLTVACRPCNSSKGNRI